MQTKSRPTAQERFVKRVMVVRDDTAFPSSAAARLYEHCARYAQGGVTPWMTIAELRSVLEKTTTYPTFAAFNARVLRPAVNEVSEASNIRYDMEFQQAGRKITHVRFVVAAQPGCLPKLA